MGLQAMPVCLSCSKVFRVQKIGVRLEEMMPAGSDRPGEWASYKLWSGDLLECPECGLRIVARFGMKPLAEHYQPDYAHMARTAISQVKDSRGIE